MGRGKVVGVVALLLVALQLNSVTFAMGRIIGPGLAVLAVNAFGYGSAFLINAVSFPR